MKFLFEAEYINRQDAKKLDAIRLKQLCAAAKNALGVDKPKSIFDRCEDKEEPLFWQYQKFIDKETKKCMYEGWFMGYIHEDSFIADCGTTFYANTADPTGIVMIQHGYQSETDDPEALKFLKVMEEETFVFKIG